MSKHTKRLNKKQGGNSSRTLINKPSIVLPTVQKPIVSEQITADMPVSEMKHLVLHKYSELLAFKSECFKNCIDIICRKNKGACQQTKDFIQSGVAMDTSGFCNNMMAGFPKTCGKTVPGNPQASYDECACNRFKHALFEFDHIRLRIHELGISSLSKIIDELMNHINNKRGSTLSNNTRKSIRLVRQTADRSLNLK
jgi:hypothetical protein